MAGEMSREDLNQDEYPLHFAIAEALNATVEPFDVYQGPYIAITPDIRSGSGFYALAPRIPGTVRLWIYEDEFGIWVLNEDNDMKALIEGAYGENGPANAVRAAIQVIPKQRLEYLRGELQAERISYEGLLELQSLVQYIEPDDVELLEAAGVPENQGAL